MTAYKSSYCKTPHKVTLKYITEFMYVFKVSIFSVLYDLSLLIVKAEYCSALPFVTSISLLKFQQEN
jgi:hypothetical protein